MLSDIRRGSWGGFRVYSDLPLVRRIMCEKFHQAKNADLYKVYMRIHTYRNSSLHTYSYKKATLHSRMTITGSLKL